MNGYLRRLGAQALYNAPGIRSLARPLQGDAGVEHPQVASEGPLSDLNGAAAVFSGPGPLHEPAASRPGPPRGTQEYADRAEGDENPAGAAINFDAPLLSIRAPASAAAPATAAAHVAPAVPRQGAARESPDRAEAREDFAVAADAEMISRAERPDAPTPGTGVRPARQRSRNSPVAAPDAIPTPGLEPAQPNKRSDTASPVDAPMSIELARAPPARQRPATRRQTDSDAASAAETPDVHIHIGRIELTAIAAPAAPRRAPPANAKAPMSLDEYLRRRNGRAP
jgi:hypothetical protein